MKSAFVQKSTANLLNKFKVTFAYVSTKPLVIYQKYLQTTYNGWYICAKTTANF